MGTPVFTDKDEKYRIFTKMIMVFKHYFNGTPKNTAHMGSLKKRHGGIMSITMDEYNAIMEGLAIP